MPDLHLEPQVVTSGDAPRRMHDDALAHAIALRIEAASARRAGPCVRAARASSALRRARTSARAVPASRGRYRRPAAWQDRRRTSRRQAAGSREAEHAPRIRREEVRAHRRRVGEGLLDQRARLPASPSGNGASVPSSTRVVAHRRRPAAAARRRRRSRSRRRNGRSTTRAGCGQSARTMSRLRQALSTRPSSHAKLPPPCANTSSSDSRQALERARQDQRQHAELRFRRHRHQPRQHPLLHAARRPSCPTDARAPACVRSAQWSRNCSSAGSSRSRSPT